MPICCPCARNRIAPAKLTACRTADEERRGTRSASRHALSLTPDRGYIVGDDELTGFGVRIGTLVAVDERMVLTQAFPPRCGLGSNVGVVSRLGSAGEPGSLEGARLPVAMVVRGRPTRWPSRFFGQNGSVSAFSPGRHAASTRKRSGEADATGVRPQRGRRPRRGRDFGQLPREDRCPAAGISAMFSRQSASSSFSIRSDSRNASTVPASSASPWAAEMVPPGHPMMSTPFESIARRSRSASPGGFALSSR